MDFRAILKAYSVIKEDEAKQKTYKKWLKQPMTAEMLEELMHSSEVFNRDIDVKLADGTEIHLPAPKKELPTNRYNPGF